MQVEVKRTSHRAAGQGNALGVTRGLDLNSCTQASRASSYLPPEPALTCVIGTWVVVGVDASFIGARDGRSGFMTAGTWLKREEGK